MSLSGTDADRDANTRRAIRSCLVAISVVASVFASGLPMSVGASGAAMKQAKRYGGPSSASAKVVAPFTCVGIDGDCGTLGVRGPLGEYGGDPVSFVVPARARSVWVSVVDDTGLPVRAFVSGHVVRGRHNWDNPVCGPSPVQMILSARPRVLRVAMDAGLWAVPDGGTLPGEARCLLSPLSVPTSGTITVVFKRG